jgi:hypothetical protein
MKLLVFAISLHLINETLQKLIGFSELKDKLVEHKSDGSVGLQQSPCRTDNWSDFNFCSNCTACNQTDYWGRLSLNVTCKPCDGYYYYSSDTSLRVLNVSSWGQPSVYQYRTDCNYGSDNQCRWNASVTMSPYSYRGYDCGPISSQNGSTTCTNKFYYDRWNSVNSNCTFCNYTTYNGSQISNASCSPGNNYTWTGWNRTIQNGTATNYSSLDNIQRYWYGDCNNTWAPISQCNYCWTCVRVGWGNGWDCDTCKAWNNQSNTTNNTVCQTYTFSDWDPVYGRSVSGNCSSCNSSDSRGYLLSSWVNCWPGYSYNYVNNDYAVHAYNMTNYTSDDNIERHFTSDCQNPYTSISQNCRFSMACTLQKRSWFGFDCFFSYQNNSNTTNNTQNMTYYSWDSSRGMTIQSQCTFNVTSSNNTNLVGCMPLNYSWVTWNTSVNGDNWVYNSSSDDSYTRYFTTDCRGSSLSDCYWVTGCSKSRYSTYGYKCWVFDGKSNQSNSSNSSNVTYFSDYDYYRSMWIQAQCNSTNSSYNQSVNCRPYNYQYVTYDSSVRSDSVYNSSSGQYDQIFYTDCDYSSNVNNCYWVTRCNIRSWNNSLSCSVRNYKGGNSSNSTNNTVGFRYDLGYGNDWCANCTQTNGSNNTTVSCQACTSYTPYTQTRCSNQIRYFQNTYGGSTCANCTSCTNGIFNCAPCGFVGEGLEQVSSEVPSAEVETLPFDEEFWEGRR